MNRIAALVVITAALVAAAPARAVSPPPESQWRDVTADANVARYVAVASDYWHARPTCAPLTVYAAPVEGAIALANSDSCRIWIRSALLRPAYRGAPRWLRRANAAQLCMVVVHEYGHILKYGHSADAESPMYGYRDGSSPITVPGCAALWPHMRAAGR